jgi:hypothetical protein
MDSPEQETPPGKEALSKETNWIAESTTPTIPRQEPVLNDRNIVPQKLSRTQKKCRKISWKEAHRRWGLLAIIFRWPIYYDELKPRDRAHRRAADRRK